MPFNPTLPNDQPDSGQEWRSDRGHWGVCWCAASRIDLTELVDQLSRRYEVTQVRPSTAGLGMLAARDSVRNEAFHLGEFSLSTAAVELRRDDGAVARGGAAILCDDESLAQGIAVLDAVVANGWEGIDDAVELLRSGQTQLSQVQATRRQIMGVTSVDFSTLDQDS
ncbi:MAG: phosphonate C-P lyase system protein PhnG [Planctomycetota bacterium]